MSSTISPPGSRTSLFLQFASPAAERVLRLMGGLEPGQQNTCLLSEKAAKPLHRRRSPELLRRRWVCNLQRSLPALGHARWAPSLKPHVPALIEGQEKPSRSRFSAWGALLLFEHTG